MVPCARSCKINGDTAPYTFMPDSGLATPCTRHECGWSCVTIFLARPCTGHNVNAGAYMCIGMSRGNDDPPAFNLGQAVFVSLGHVN